MRGSVAQSIDSLSLSTFRSSISWRDREVKRELATAPINIQNNAKTHDLRRSFGDTAIPELGKNPTIARQIENRTLANAHMRFAIPFTTLRLIK